MGFPLPSPTVLGADGHHLDSVGVQQNFDKLSQILDGLSSQGLQGLFFRPGDLKLAAYSTPDAGWLLCDGSAVSRTGFPALFARISTNFGVGDGSTTFNVPDFRGRGPIGVGTGDATGATAHAFASKAGEEKHTLTITEMPSHQHVPRMSTSSGLDYSAFGIGGPFNANGNAAQINATGGDGPHNNLGPSLTTNFFIKT